MIHAGTLSLQGKEIPGELVSNAHEATARMEGSHPVLLAQIQKLNSSPDGELRNKGIVATALVIEQGGYDPSAHRQLLQSLEHPQAPQQHAELSR